MDMRRLQFLVRVIDIGSITKAAAVLRIAQPALSQHIRALERSAGAKLLTRHKGGVVPTAAGTIAYQNAKLLARQLDRARAEVRLQAALPTGRVTVGIAPHSHARQLIQPLLQRVAGLYPDILLHISENFEGVLAQDLRMGRMDMALLYEVVPRPGLRSNRISVETLHLIGRRDILGPASASLSESVPMLLPGPTHAIRQLVEAVFSRRRIRPRVVAEIESFETLAAAVTEGLGATVLPRSVAPNLVQAHGLAIRPFGTATTTIALVFSTAEGGLLSDAAQVVGEIVADLAAGAAGDTGRA